ncbi:hypothetical protein LDK12_05990 [Fusobacterium pseudoperiodonticum]|uniref:hypothetical protein n=1 Tax=Fusobacterium pseudoperiodonticum TaxID=2663009 RepID=UPI0030D31C18
MIELPKAIQKNKEEINKELKEEVRNEIQEDIKEEEKEVEENFQKIYIGPTIAEFSLQEYTIFVNGYPSNIEEAIKKYPLTEKLFINVEDLNLKNNEYYRTLYNTLKNEIRGNINGI